MAKKYKKRIKFDSIIMDACRDKQTTSKLEKLASAVIKKHPRLNEAKKFAQAAGKLSKTIHQIYGDKKIPSIEKQLADLK